MRTTIVLDDDLLAKAQALTSLQEKSSSVSYTHLDVYKRQLQCCILYKSLQRKWDLQAQFRRTLSIC